VSLTNGVDAIKKAFNILYKVFTTISNYSSPDGNATVNSDGRRYISRKNVRHHASCCDPGRESHSFRLFTNNWSGGAYGFIALACRHARLMRNNNLIIISTQSTSNARYSKSVKFTSVSLLHQITIASSDDSARLTLSVMPGQLI
jgi:hypothetical protein